MLVVYAAATFVAVRHEFLEQLDEQLHDDFETAEGFLTRTSEGRIAWSGDRRHDPDNDLEEVDRLTTLVDTLLRLSQGDAGTVRLSSEPIDLGKLTQEVVASLAIL